jgi:hypothetical protein
MEFLSRRFLAEWKLRLSDSLSYVVYGHIPRRKFSSLMVYRHPKCSGLRYNNSPHLGDRPKSQATLEIKADLSSEQFWQEIGLVHAEETRRAWS